MEGKKCWGGGGGGGYMLVVTQSVCAYCIDYFEP